jgi:hypothetical protein
MGSRERPLQYRDDEQYGLPGIWRDGLGRADLKMLNIRGAQHRPAAPAQQQQQNREESDANDSHGDAPCGI